MNRREELIEAAKDLNEVLGLAPEIDVSGYLKDIVEDIREAAQLITEADKISEETKQVIKGLVAPASPGLTISPALVAKQGEVVEKGEEEGIKRSSIREKSPLGHLLNSQGGRIDRLLLEGTHSLEEIATELDCRLARVKGHLASIKKEGHTVIVNKIGKVLIHEKK